MISSVLLAIQATVPNTGAEFNFNRFLIITVSCILAVLIIPRVIRYPHVGPKMPLPFPSIFNNPSVGAFLAAMSTGHLVGIGAVLGLTNLGII
ncbi:photosystem I reaction center subunit PsaK [Brasilonema sp. UFV-L1]|uniref:photosystem I reaction center subunit PsaK n=1 Tax=Brasilonema sp. UFV-L1 TaxID=2234130 RepID=UPI0030D97D36